MAAPKYAPLTGDEWTSWALFVELPSNPSIGKHAVGRVLVALCQYAGADGLAWPSADKLAADVSGLIRWDIRNALGVLEEAGLIRRTKKTGVRSVCWQIVTGLPVHAPAVEVAGGQAGYPATHSTNEQAGEVAGQLAGQLAGGQAGGQAGYPATNRTEQKRTFPPAPESIEPPASTRPADGGGEEKTISWLMANKGLDAATARAVVAHATADPSTGSLGRLRTGYLDTCLAAVEQQRRAARQAELAAGAKCADHATEPAAACRSCAGDIKAGQRDRRFAGLHQPDCAAGGCWTPLIGQPAGATLCRVHEDLAAAAEAADTGVTGPAAPHAGLQVPGGVPLPPGPFEAASGAHSVSEQINELGVIPA